MKYLLFCDMFCDDGVNVLFCNGSGFVLMFSVYMMFIGYVFCSVVECGLFLESGSLFVYC